ncbi:MAG TPA: type IV secretion protein Rhs [Blastocatellia bacterium]|nr:type IV secretion protein Rhs [Blastocatellia bacterium]
MSSDLVMNSNASPGLPSTDYYAPNFKVMVEGRELDATTHGDILDLQVTMDSDNLTNFNLTVNNWDDSSFDFKYSDTTTFDIGKQVHIQMGYADELRYMVSGLIQTLSPRFPDTGPPTMAVSGVEKRIKLRDRKPAPGDIKKFVNKADWEIAEIIAQRNGLESRVTKQGEKHALVMQKNQDDLTFLMERAKRMDFDFYVRVDPATGRDKLYFVSPTDSRDARQSYLYVFEWGKNLINYSSQLTLNNQVGNVTVRGWDPATKRAITYTAKPSDLPQAGGGTTGAKAAEKHLPKRNDQVVDLPVTSAQEARDLAISLLRERAYQFLTGSGQVIGLPDMRPGDLAELRGLGQRFSGPPGKPILYYIKKVTHSIGGSGYLTQFEVRSTADGGTRQGGGGTR